MSEEQNEKDKQQNANLNENSAKQVNHNNKTACTQTSLDQKKSLKQQAKQLLLRGCYLMAANKYTKLIDMDIRQLAVRQQAIIYLNCGICFQFMSQGNKKNFVEALNYMKKALSVDSTYQKTYYRLIQLLRDQGYYETALSLVPESVNNKEIDLLLVVISAQLDRLKESDFTKMLEKFKTKEVTTQNVHMLCLKLQETVCSLIQTHPNYIEQAENQQTKTKIQKLSEQISLFYVMIGNFDADKPKQFEDSDNRRCVMHQFVNFLTNLCVQHRKENINQTLLIDHLTQPTLKYYRGVLNKYLQNKASYGKGNICLSKDSMFLSDNQFVKTTKRILFFPEEFGLVRHIRLIDINIQLYAKTLSYLNELTYEALRIMIKEQKTVQPGESRYGSIINQFLITNRINSGEVIRQGISLQTQNTQVVTRNGGHPYYLFRYLTKNQLNFMMLVFLHQCEKFSSIYESSVIHPIWLQNLHHITFSINSLLYTIINMIQVYLARQTKSIGNFYNEITEVNSLSNLMYIQHWQIHSQNQRQKSQFRDNPKQKQTNVIQNPSYGFKYDYGKLIDYFQSQNDNFISVYFLEKIFQFIQKSPVNSDAKSEGQAESKSKPSHQQNKLIHKQRIIEISVKKLQYIHKKIIQSCKQNTQQNYVYKEMYLILICIVLKLDIKSPIKIDQKIVVNQIYKDFVSDIALQALLLILINKPAYVTYYLQNSMDITRLIKHFLSKPLIEKIEPFKVLLNVIYILVCDFQNDQEIYFAKKLGVSQQEVHQVRKLQKEAIDENLKQITIKLKKKFKMHVSSQWLEVLNQLCRLVRVTLKMEAFCSVKLCKIIFSIAEVNHSKLYSTQIIEFMLQSRKVVQQGPFQFNIKQTACKFFQIICKKCNAQIFEYKHLQSIVDSLVWLISNCEHELTYFESLLGLVNLSTMSVRIPIQQIQKCLYEQNSYIVHSGVCVMNNILIYSEQLVQDEKKSKNIRNRISDIVYKYIEFYRDQILTIESQLPEGDYSHPKKIYNSLISLATVLKLDKLEELESWEKGKKYIKVLANNEAPQLMFKLAIYHSLEEKLPRNWQVGLGQELQSLRKNQPQKYSKLAQIM